MILGAVFTDSVIVQRSTFDRQYVWVGTNSTINESQLTKAARMFHALKTNLGRLKMYYQKLEPTGDLPVSSRFLPFNHCLSSSKWSHSFRICWFLEKLPRRTASLSELEPTLNRLRISLSNLLTDMGKRHTTLLADENFAPRILFYGSPRLL